MKKKHIAIAMSMIMAATFAGGCGSSTSTSSDAEATTVASESTDAVYGEITSISDDTITISVGTMKERGDAPDQKRGDRSDSKSSDATQSSEANQSSDSTQSGDSAKSDNSTQASEGSTEDTSNDNSSAEAGKQAAPEGGNGDFSMLDLTGETMEITVTDDTKIEKQSFGGGGQMPSGQAPSDGNAPSGQAPSDGNAPSGQTPPSGDVPDKPAEDSTGDSSSTAPSGQAPDMSSQTEEISLSDLSEGDTISVTTDEDGNVTEITLIMSKNGMVQGGPSGNSSDASTISYTAVKEFTEDADSDGETYESTGTDENAVLVSNGASVTINDATVTRNSSDSTGGDNSSFYGVGAAVLTTDGVTNINDSTISTDSAGGAGVFAYGEDSEVYVSNSTISTKQDTSGGIHVAGGGTLTATDCTVETEGESSAAIRSDRGGGSMKVDGGSYTSNGTGSPAVYCTADIEVANATLEATNSEAVCIEGLNSLKLTDCDLTGNMPENDQNDCTWNVILYQSMSGDSEVGNGTFTMEGGTLTAKNGGMFYTTNTESTFNLEDVAITYTDENDYFLKCTGNSNKRGWGTSGSNGAQCTFNATDQEMEGDIIWDSISTLDFDMSSGSTLTGAIINDESNAGDGGDGYCNLTIDEDSTWIVTADSTLSALSNKGTIKDSDGKTVSITGTDGTSYVKGDSSYTITVTSYEE